MKLRTLIPAVVALAMGAGAAQSQDIVATASGNPDFERLVQAVQAAGLVETLQGPGPFTVFAPTDAAFDALGSATFDRLAGNPDELRPILTYHVVAGRLNAADLYDGQMLTTVNGQMLRVRRTGNTVMVGNATVRQADVQTSNGTIHVIDRVLMPSMAVTK